MLEWSDLHIFLTVAEQGSLSAAARELGLSQPTVGRRLTALEEQLGSALVVRTARGLTLTEAGSKRRASLHVVDGANVPVLLNELRKSS